MKKNLIILLLLFPTLLLSQTHLVIPGKTSTTVSFGRDQNIDFFGEGKFVRSSYANKINVGYVYNGLVGVDFSYGYSYYDRKDTYTFDLTGEQSNPDGDPQFNFTESFRFPSLRRYHTSGRNRSGNIDLQRFPQTNSRCGTYLYRTLCHRRVKRR